MRRLALPLALLLGLVLALPATAASGRFPGSIQLPPGWQPEGITAGRGTTLYVGSLADGSIWRGDARTGTGAPFIAGPGGQAAGVEYEARANRLWVAGGMSHEVRVYDLSSGQLLRTWTIAGSGFLNDLVVTRDAVYVTDSSASHLVVIPLGPGGALPPTDGATTLPLDGITIVPNQFNLNGIVARGRWLIAVQTINGTLWRIDPATGAATAIGLVGGAGASAANGDGLEMLGSTLYVVRNFSFRVSAFRLSGDLTSAVWLGDLTGALDVATTAAVQAGRLWAVNARFTTPPTPTTPYSITRLPLRP